MSNSENPSNGAYFEHVSSAVLAAHFGVPFRRGVPVAIGSPAKPHKFDLGAIDDTIIVECKRHTWTSGGNSPSAKLAVLNEARGFLDLVRRPGVLRILAMARDVHPRKGALADHYYNRYGHLLGQIALVEIDVDRRVLRLVAGNLSR